MFLVCKTRPWKKGHSCFTPQKVIPAPIAQLEECHTSNVKVAGSSPARSELFLLIVIFLIYFLFLFLFFFERKSESPIIYLRQMKNEI